MLVLSRTDVEDLLDLDQLVDAVAAAMADLSAGRASMPPRGAAVVAERQAMLAAMPAFLPSVGALTTKLVSLFPENRDRPTHQAIICCFDPATGAPVAVMDGSHITATRTAAGSALASRYLARGDATVVAVIGAGVQARPHARAMARLPSVESIRVAARDQAKAESLVDDLRLSGIAAERASSVEEAVARADIVCATTHADKPVLRREWLRPGTHVHSVGYNSSGEGEIDQATIADALVVVESRESALAAPPAGAIELRLAVEAGLIDRAHIHAELGELVTDVAQGRAEETTITSTSPWAWPFRMRPRRLLCLRRPRGGAPGPIFKM
jgi:ornithine cyclodeaminase